MNILILGLGSIGQRHLRNLNKLKINAKYFAYRKKFSSPSLSTFNKVLKTNIKKKYSLNYINNLKDIKRKNIDCAFVCTPSSHHAEQTIFLLKNNINCFIEKPLATNFSQLKKIEKILKSKKNIITMIGYQLKFNPIINYLEKIIYKKNAFLGKILYVNISHGEHIDDFHPYESYKGSYAATKKLGGGVVLSQIHEIDYFLNLFKGYKIIKSNSLSSKVTDLDIDVEDVFTSSFLLKNRKYKNKILCNLNLNYFERPKRRKIQILGSRGSLSACLNSQKIEIFKKNKKSILKFKYKKNDIFIKEIKYFIDHVKNKKKINDRYNIINGIKTSSFALKLRKKIH